MKRSALVALFPYFHYSTLSHEASTPHNNEVTFPIIKVVELNIMLLQNDSLYCRFSGVVSFRLVRQSQGSLSQMYDKELYYIHNTYTFVYIDTDV